jgi:hypothetical protein
MAAESAVALSAAIFSHHLWELGNSKSIGKLTQTLLNAP